MEKIIKKYNFCDTDVLFYKKDNQVYINVTQIAQKQGKRVQNFLRTQQTKDFMQLLENQISSEKRNAEYQAVKIVRSGNVSPEFIGTWMHEKLALKFATWISPQFELWVYERIQELLKYGFTADENTLEKMIANPDLVISLASELKKERMEKEIALKDVERLAPKAQFADKLTNTNSLIDIGKASKLLSLTGRNTMFKALKDSGIFFKNRNEPKQQYINKDYFRLKAKVITAGGKERLITQVFLTPKGLQFIDQKFQK